jgi:hypothetical protein
MYVQGLKSKVQTFGLRARILWRQRRTEGFAIQADSIEQKR